MDTDSAAPLRDAWYFALSGAALKPGQLTAKTLLGEKLVLGRGNDSQVFALHDFCPHRGMPLRHGRFDGNEIECCYHGWRFDCTGACTAIPSLATGQDIDTARIRAKNYPAAEIQGNIWVFFGEDPANAPAIPVLPDIGARSPDLFESVRFACTIDHAVVGLMDPAHGPYVHRAWWWRSRRSIHDKQKAFGASPFGFTMLRHTPSKNSKAYKLLGGKPETEIAFRLPSVRIEHIRAGKHVLVNLTAITPISAEESEINHAIYWTLPWLAPLRPVLRPFVRAFLRQDRDIMLKQREGVADDPVLMLLGDADAQARWYYRLKREYRMARAERRDFVNPVRDQVLRWRS